EVSGRMWPRSEGGERLRMRIVHPMDTGLANGIPAFHIQDLRIADAAGAELMQIDLFEPVAENPVLTFDLPAGMAPERVRITGRDNNGNPVDAWVER
ncbi:MAG: quinoprotein dehydrogenase-associated SoxYZ-like carrier, partial [Zoogloea sp.]|nr:quinoprotein dehydrogenase-associated SoxYZ-like carrier [Zoogloea sp.]